MSPPKTHGLPMFTISSIQIAIPWVYRIFYRHPNVVEMELINRNGGTAAENMDVELRSLLI
jgi:hypothetical protein